MNDTSDNNNFFLQITRDQAELLCSAIPSASNLVKFDMAPHEFHRMWSGICAATGAPVTAMRNLRDSLNVLWRNGVYKIRCKEGLYSTEIFLLAAVLYSQYNNNNNNNNRSSETVSATAPSTVPTSTAEQKAMQHFTAAANRFLDKLAVAGTAAAADKKMKGCGDDDDGAIRCFCLDAIQVGTGVRLATCKHIFHRECLGDLLRSRFRQGDALPRCPLCRSKMSSEPLCDFDQLEPEYRQHQQNLGNGAVFGLSRESEILSAAMLSMDKSFTNVLPAPRVRALLMHLFCGTEGENGNATSLATEMIDNMMLASTRQDGTVNYTEMIHAYFDCTIMPREVSISVLQNEWDREGLAAKLQQQRLEELERDRLNLLEEVRQQRDEPREERARQLQVAIQFQSAPPFIRNPATAPDQEQGPEPELFQEVREAQQRFREQLEERERRDVRPSIIDEAIMEQQLRDLRQRREDAAIVAAASARVVAASDAQGQQQQRQQSSPAQLAPAPARVPSPPRRAVNVHVSSNQTSNSSSNDVASETTSAAAALPPPRRTATVWQPRFSHIGW